MSIGTRIAALEVKLGQGESPAVVLFSETGATRDEVVGITLHAGGELTRSPGESLDDLVHRAVAANPLARAHVLWLIYADRTQGRDFLPQPWPSTSRTTDNQENRT